MCEWRRAAVVCGGMGRQLFRYVYPCRPGCRPYVWHPLDCMLFWVWHSGVWGVCGQAHWGPRQAERIGGGRGFTPAALVQQARHLGVGAAQGEKALRIHPAINP